ncbi:MAG: hypothetical protein R2867_28130 [Caldilineaceae bacterium]
MTPIEHHAVADAVNGDQPRHFTFAMDNNMAWTINRRTFAMDEVAEEETVRFGDRKCGTSTMEWWQLEVTHPPAV